MSGSSPSTAARGTILVVMSSAHQLDLRDGKHYPTGYYLNEFVIPFRKLIAAGYSPVIATPKGDMPVMDINSNQAMFFGGDDAQRAEALAFVQHLEALKTTKRLRDVASEGIDRYAGLFIPGGHAPMQDLASDADLGTILRRFHDAQKITGIICHGPVVLLSALHDSAAFQAALEANDGTAHALAADWPYSGYRMTVFSTGEEQQLEGPNGLGGMVRFYPVTALAEAGAHVDTYANWHSNVVVDRELITGQQPMSAGAFGDALVAHLNTALAVA